MVCAIRRVPAQLLEVLAGDTRESVQRDLADAREADVLQHFCGRSAHVKAGVLGGRIFVVFHGCVSQAKYTLGSCVLCS